jgi:hypothetical protein
MPYDDGRSEKILRAYRHEPVKHVHPKLAMSLLERMLEHHAFAFDLVADAVFLFFDRGVQFSFERADLLQKQANFIVHGNPFRCVVLKFIAK